MTREQNNIKNLIHKTQHLRLCTSKWFLLCGTTQINSWKKYKTLLSESSRGSDNEDLSKTLQDLRSSGFQRRTLRRSLLPSSSGQMTATSKTLCLPFVTNLRDWPVQVFVRVLHFRQHTVPRRATSPRAI